MSQFHQPSKYYPPIPCSVFEVGTFPSQFSVHQLIFIQFPQNAMKKATIYAQIAVAMLWLHIFIKFPH